MVFQIIIRINGDYISVYKIENFLIPKFLIIYIVNEIYENIKFFITDESENDFSQNTFNNKINELNIFIHLFEKLDTGLEKIDFNNRDYLKNSIGLCKELLPEICNKYTHFFENISVLSFLNFDTDLNTAIFSSDDLLSLAWLILLEKIQASFKKGSQKRCSVCNKIIVVTNNQTRCEKCRKNYDGQQGTKRNKKKIILEILLLAKDYIFFNDELNKIIIDFEELRDSGKIDNIDSHDYQIGYLKKLKTKFILAINKHEYKQ